MQKGGLGGVRLSKGPGPGSLGPFEPRENFGLHSKRDEKPVEDFEQENDLRIIYKSERSLCSPMRKYTIGVRDWEARSSVGPGER